MSHCSSGGCANCSGCANELTLTQQEIDLLMSLGQFSFLPVARRADDMTPVYLEETVYPKEEYSMALQHLEQKKLISIDYDAPLPGADMSAYCGFPVHGSFALTQRGQAVVEMLEIQGVTE